MAPVETDNDNRTNARENLRIVFLHSDDREFLARMTQGMPGRDQPIGLQTPQTAATSELEALANAAKFTAVSIRIAASRDPVKSGQ
jgi:hypothetical protein